MYFSVNTSYKKNMIEIFKIIATYVGAALMMGYSLALLIVMLITIVYSVGYLYDSVLGNDLYKLGIYISKKYPRIKKIKILVRIKRAIEPRKQFVRYETPLCTYCFSFTALLIIYSVLDTMDVEYGWIFAFILYIMMYFIGMYRRYKGSVRYSLVLDNNLEFLKLSFLPMTFLITVVGFFFTIAGFNLQEIDWEYFSPIISSVQENGLFTTFTNELWLVIESSILVLLLMYIISIPMQLVSYYVVLVIKYFQKYGYGYKKIVDYFFKMWRRNLW